MIVASAESGAVRIAQGEVPGSAGLGCPLDFRDADVTISELNSDPVDTGFYVVFN